MPDLRRRHPHDVSPDAGAHRPAHRRACAVRLHDHRADRTFLFEVLSALEPRRLLRPDGEAPRGAAAAYFAHVLRPAFAGGARAHPGAGCRAARTRRLLDGARPRLPAPVRGIPARIRPERGENRFPHLAYHPGHGETRRRLYHHGLREHPRADARGRAARHIPPLYVRCAAGGGASRRVGHLPSRRAERPRRALFVRFARHGAGRAPARRDRLRRPESRDDEPRRRLYRADRKILNRDTMIKAIFYKEWIKMRWFCLVAAYSTF